MLRSFISKPGMSREVLLARCGVTLTGVWSLEKGFCLGLIRTYPPRLRHDMLSTLASLVKIMFIMEVLWGNCDSSVHLPSVSNLQERAVHERLRPAHLLVLVLPQGVHLHLCCTVVELLLGNSFQHLAHLLQVPEAGTQALPLLLTEGLHRSSRNIELGTFYYIFFYHLRHLFTFKKCS